MYITVARYARKYNLHQNTVRNLIEKGEIKAIRIGRQYRINEADLPQVEPDIVDEKFKLYEMRLKSAGYTASETAQIIEFAKDVF